MRIPKSIFQYLLRHRARTFRFRPRQLFVVGGLSIIGYNMWKRGTFRSFLRFHNLHNILGFNKNASSARQVLSTKEILKPRQGV